MSHKMTRGQGGKTNKNRRSWKENHTMPDYASWCWKTWKYTVQEHANKSWTTEKHLLKNLSLSLFICVFPLMKYRKWPKNVCMGRLWWSICTAYHHMHASLQEEQHRVLTCAHFAEVGNHMILSELWWNKCTNALFMLLAGLKGQFVFEKLVKIGKRYPLVN